MSKARMKGYNKMLKLYTELLQEALKEYLSGLFDRESYSFKVDLYCDYLRGAITLLHISGEIDFSKGRELVSRVVDLRSYYLNQEVPK